MSLTETFELDRPTAPTAPLDATAGEIASAIEQAVADGNPHALSDAGLRRVLAALGKLYAAKTEAADDEELPPVERDALTATETALFVCALLRAADLNMLDLAMWFARGDSHERLGRSS